MAVPILRVRLSILFAFLMICSFASGSSSWAGDQIDHTGSLQLMTEALEWQSTMPLRDEFSIIDEEDPSGMDRRSLYWRAARHFYISYGALAANRIPCPARSGRSYYTHNCHRAGSPVNPYHRGCSRITRCRR